MKIAIMTQPLGHNYGGIMQAWALQQVIKKLGHDVVTIDRQPDDKGPTYKLIRIFYRTLLKMVGKRKAYINFEKQNSFIQRYTKKFIAEHIEISEKIDDSFKLKNNFKKNKYDAVIVGSDQTWRPKYSPNIKNFFLDFLEGFNLKRIAYASSFGVDEWEFSTIETKVCAELVKKFNAISVREKSAVELCHKYFNVNAQHVLDPTLLLVRLDYENLIGPERLNIKNQGIFTYFLDNNTKKINLAEKLKYLTGEFVYSCQAKHNLNNKISECIDDYVMPDPKDWIAGFANSKYILTDSFHGMVFSIIFNKPFIAIINKNRGASRFESLASILKIEHHVVDESFDGSFDFLTNKEINYEEINFNIINLQKKSISFIVNNIN